MSDEKQKHEHKWEPSGSGWKCACGVAHPPVERVAYTYYETPDKKWRAVEITFDGKQTREKVLEETFAPAIAASIAKKHEIDRFRGVAR